MQIHELNQFSGTPGSGDYLAIDNGTETMKVPANAAVLAIARTISDAWVDISAAKVNLNTTAPSGTDHDLYTAITALGWASDVIE